MILTRVRTDGGDLLVETDHGTTEEINAVVSEIYNALNPQTLTCDEAHPHADIWHREGHPVHPEFSLEPIRYRRWHSTANA